MNITQQAQKAWAAYLKSLTLDSVESGQIYRGIEGAITSESDEQPQTRLLPCVIVECRKAVESAPFTGNWTADVIIKVRSNADDTTEDEHHDFASEVFSNCWQSNIVSDLNNQDNFTVQQVRAKEQGYDLIDRSWESYIAFEVECCASKLNP